MRVLILSVTAGFGHHATAKAIGDMLESKGAEVHTLDVYAYISNLIKTTIDKGYLFSSKHMQTLYRLVYQLAENNGASYFNSAPSIINIINALGASKFSKVIANHVPDVIICTHVFAAQMVDELKKRKKLADIETIGIPLHWGDEGVAKKGFIANTLTQFVGDANTQTPEFKAFLVNVEKV